MKRENREVNNQKRRKKNTERTIDATKKEWLRKKEGRKVGGKGDEEEKEEAWLVRDVS